MPYEIEVEKDTDGEITGIKRLTWEQYKNWAVAIARAEGPKAGFPIGQTGSQLIYTLGGMQMAYDIDYFPKLDSSASQAVYNLILEMGLAGAIVNVDILNQYARPVELLKNGDLWLSFAHMGPLGDAYRAAPDAYIVAPGPLGSSGKAGSTTGAGTFGIVKGAKNRELAQKFIAYAVDKKNNYEYCKGLGGCLSPIIGVTEMLENSDTDIIMKAGLDTATLGLRAVEVPSGYINWFNVKAAYEEFYRSALAGTPLTEDMLKAWQKKIDAEKKK